MSLVLRHRPDRISITLDSQGYVEVGDLLMALAASGRSVTREQLETVVATNDKQRFAFNEDKTKIRASQGHSVEVDLDLEPQEPPDVLYHGTAMRYEFSIQQQGLLKRSRQHVHLSADKMTAHKVGSRHGTAIVLPVDAKRMHRDGHAFYLSDNGVWLTEHVPPQYLTVQP